jgi:Flp pilus assembly protein TadB
MANVYLNHDAAPAPILRDQQRLADPPAEPSLAELLSTLVTDAQMLVRKEFALARREIMQEIEKTRQGAIILGIGAGILAIGGILLLVALVQGLVVWYGIPVWVSYLIVGGAFALVGGVMVMMGSGRLKQVHPMPEETIDSVRKDISWIKEQNPSDKT